MRFGLVISIGAVLAQPVLAASPLELFPGIFTNEEDVYFTRLAGKTPPPATAMEVLLEGKSLRLRTIDAYGKPLEDGHLMTISGTNVTAGPCGMPFRSQGKVLVAGPRTGKCHNEAVMQQIGPEGITLAFPDGSTSLLRRSRPVICWVSILKPQPKPDGSEDWYFQRGVRLHDQGGRALVGGGDTGAQPTIIRVRNVTWEPGSTNKPALTLYVHKPERPDHAESYSWAAPDSSRIGINLRWMQAGCAVGNQPATASVNSAKTKG